LASSPSSSSYLVAASSFPSRENEADAFISTFIHPPFFPVL
jgi:hypothetical protein